MENEVLDNVNLYDDPVVFYQAMLDDINAARNYIYLEIYKFGHDSNGTRFRDHLAKKCAEGVQVRLLLDSWGTPPNPAFFEKIVKQGGEVRYFKKIRFFIDFFTKNHRRNHRKLLIIDDRITYIGSANITAYSMKWRELMIRLDGPITPLFRKAFLDNYKLYRKYIFNKFSFKKTIHYKGFEIIQDLPSIYRQQVKKRYEKLIKNARHEIVIESPYFIPGYKIRRNMMLAARRGVKVHVIMPHHSDVRLVDFLRDKYMGFYYNCNINIHYYQPANLHAKCLLVDNEIFAIGSANFDYRSFRYLHEIILVGNHKKIVDLLRIHLDLTLNNCVGFNYLSWKRRPLFEKIFGWFLIPFRHLF
ncbi:MAG: phosphatidylserine/phosphatidylglycerophosphate/cardiolipin synthase family protein [Bacteroidota bacterium]